MAPLYERAAFAAALAHLGAALQRLGKPSEVHSGKCVKCGDRPCASGKAHPGYCLCRWCIDE